jgi:hypothetical protein
MQPFSLPFSSIETKNHKIDTNICEIENRFQKCCYFVMTLKSHRATVILMNEN